MSDPHSISLHESLARIFHANRNKKAAKRDGIRQRSVLTQGCMGIDFPNHNVTLRQHPSDFLASAADQNKIGRLEWPGLGDTQEFHSINTGVPHVVLFMNDLEQAPVLEVGRALRHHVRFTPDGTNVNFVTVIAPNHLAVRTFERGVEGETLACGTGVVASAITHHLLSKTASPISVTVRGGETLEVGFVSESGINRLLAELADASEVQGVSGAQTRSVPEVLEEAIPASVGRTFGATQQFAAAVELGKKSNNNLPQIKHVTLMGPAEFVFEGTIMI